MVKIFDKLAISEEAFI